MAGGLSLLAADEAPAGVWGILSSSDEIGGEVVLRPILRAVWNFLL